jgi:hypothetical protein
MQGNEKGAQSQQVCRKQQGEISEASVNRVTMEGQKVARRFAGLRGRDVEMTEAVV